MKIYDFSKLETIKDMKDIIGKKMQKYDRFLYGQSMTTQMENKSIGNDISYYEVVDILPNGNILYEMRFDKLEE